MQPCLRSSKFTSSATSGTCDNGAARRGFRMRRRERSGPAAKGSSPCIRWSIVTPAEPSRLTGRPMLVPPASSKPRGLRTGALLLFISVQPFLGSRSVPAGSPSNTLVRRPSTSDHPAFAIHSPPGQGGDVINYPTVPTWTSRGQLGSADGHSGPSPADGPRPPPDFSRMRQPGDPFPLMSGKGRHRTHCRETGIS